MAYVDKEALLAKCAHEKPWGADAVIAMIEDFPAADVVTWEQLKKIWEIANHDVRPVRNGRWVKARGSWCTPGGDPVWECSECGKGRHVYGIEHGTYGSDVADGQWVSCPNCGADMRGE